ncbi:phage shock protein PspC (stress-responsive transcriptional regulator)/FtsH-binding integral membrane protein [Agromyces hippuratus]|uniref:Phage shock protein PspC (Stress-responsive transcriptional regulator)/FtsH-binding integral membrane protein n=1 Tax=Agromyces hippuratus TaxID=286438 RepID=A0A852WV39_9MICO|nr:PspC domain-containing protein [Agromyces hippuratus]NYG22192.1 phage shock protein PspC (stress-responsive transcriptional regulator)/FtsH-binding integral membrane protein [Agromyces hippuratus]
METNPTAPEADPVQDDVKGDSTASGPNAHGAAGATPSSGDPGAATPAPGTGTGLYDWLRRLGVPRRAGWLGGVCAGVAARLGIDPIIVRGIVVVVAVLGAPFVLLYAIAWLLLPDTEGEIHVERLIRGIVDPAIVGIAVMGVIGLIPLVQGGWLGWRWWPDWPTFIDPIFGLDLAWPLRVLWVLIVIVAIVAFVVWLAQRASQNSPSGVGARMASAAAGAAPGHPSTAAFAAAAAPATASAPAPADSPGAATDASTAVPTTEPPVPAEGADAAAIAEWRAQHEAWRVSHAEWKSGQEQAERAARAQAAAENKAKARELTAQADAARAARRASRPRASAAFVFTVLGLALVGGSIAAIWALNTPDVAGFAIPIALAVATLLLAVGMVVAALRRRRSGALAFTTLLSALAMTVAVIAASVLPAGVLVPPNYSVSLDRSQRLVQPYGDAYVYATPWFRDVAPVVELTQGTGDTWITIDPDTEVVLDASRAGEIEITAYSQDFSSTTTPQIGGLDRGALILGGEDIVREFHASDEPVDAKIVLEQGSGMVHIEIREGE